MGEVPHPILQELTSRLGKVYEGVASECRLDGKLEIPATAYDSLRGQYRSDTLLKHISSHRMAGDRMLAVTSVDLYSPPLNFVFGQAQSPGRVCLISLFRLDPTFYGEPANHKLFLERATKEAIHELGHTFGLSHCSKPECVMSFSNSIFEVDGEKSSFCETCRKQLGI